LCVATALLVAAPAASASPNGLVISEVSTGSGQFVELLNAGNAPVPLSVCLHPTSIAFTASCPSGTLVPGQHYLIGETGQSFPVTPDQTMGIGALVASNDGIAIRDATTQQIIDQVGYGSQGTSSFVEGTRAPNPPAGDSIVRKNGGTQDTDNNAQDFELDLSVGPQNTATIDDLDGDGLLGAGDNCGAVANPDQANLDGDVLGDACDADIDGDGVANAADNCPAAANPDQLDTDLDGSGNLCDSDDDADAVPDASDDCPLLPGAAANGCPLRLIGTAGDDLLIGSLGADTMSGFAGADRIFGLDGNDTLDGGDGNDRLDGGEGNDRLAGGSDNDSLAGREGRDRLAGDNGNDRLNGGVGRDRVSGGSGRDNVLAVDGERDTVNCGPGPDRVRADRRDRLRRCERVRRAR
jgi:Ca2+-binding RTX toxin-like protein